MGKANILLAALNRGRVSRLALGRDDLDGNRIRYGGEVQTNIMPRVMGSAMLRPGLAYTGYGRNHLPAKHLDFSVTDDQALIELTHEAMRVKIDEQPIIRTAVSTTVQSGDFSSDTGWTDADDAGATSTIAGGFLTMVGTAFAEAVRKQQVTVSAGDLGKEHALRIIVTRGPVTLRVGSTDGGDEYVRETSLREGEHSLAFTPTGSFWIRFSSLRRYGVIVDSCVIEGAGDMVLPTPWPEDKLSRIRHYQSEDVIYTYCKAISPRRIERRGAGRSWSVVKFMPEDGPFRVENTSTTRLTPSGIYGDITVASSRPLFKAGHVGGLFQITSVGQLVEASISGEGQWSDPIRVVGQGSAQRTFTIDIRGTWAGRVRLQRSLDEPGAWVNVSSRNWTANQSTSYNDGLSNQIVYYRIGIATGEYTSGQAAVALEYPAGGITGVVKVTGFNSESSVNAVVLKTLGGTASTSEWREGEWSDYRGWPMAGVIDDGRLCQAGYGKFWASVSDAYESHDPEVEGDSGPINRSIPGTSALDVNWLLSLQRICVGIPKAVAVVRSSSFDEPITPTLFGMKSPSDRGSAPVMAVKDGTSGIFVGRSTDRLYELKYSGESLDYGTDDGDLTAVVPEIGEAGFVAVAIQHNPDTRIHALRADGTVGVLVKDKAENVLCWIDVETDGFVEDIVIQDNAGEDKVYYYVRRDVNGSTVRYLERWALEKECRGGDINKIADCHIVYDGAETAMITGLAHLEGREVIVWGDGRAAGVYTVAAGEIQLESPVRQAVVGLYYRGRFRGTKASYAAQMGTPMSQRKKINQFGLLLADTHHKGIQYGGDFDHMFDLPQRRDGAPVAPDTVYKEYETEMWDFPSSWGTDPRLHLEMHAPYPCTVQAVVLNVTTHDKG